MLEDWGHTTVEASTGKEVLHIAGHEALDAILLDLIMPEMQGFEVLQHLRGRPHIAPIIVITADIQHEVRAECLALGAAAFINKPVNPAELQESLNDVLRPEDASRSESSPT